MHHCPECLREGKDVSSQTATDNVMCERCLTYFCFLHVSEGRHDCGRVKWEFGKVRIDIKGAKKLY